jgi:hypothetical protein
LTSEARQLVLHLPNTAKQIAWLARLLSDALFHRTRRMLSGSLAVLQSCVFAKANWQWQQKNREEQ